MGSNYQARTPAELAQLAKNGRGDVVAIVHQNDTLKAFGDDSAVLSRLCGVRMYQSRTLETSFDSSLLSQVEAAVKAQGLACVIVETS